VMAPLPMVHVPATTPPLTTIGEIHPAWRLTSGRRPGGMTWGSR
jgi:hypothetical protein